MTYMLMIFAGGVTGLYLAGPVGTFVGVLAGLGFSAWLEQTEPTASEESHDGELAPDDGLQLRDHEGACYISDDDDLMSYQVGNHSPAGEINPATGLPMLGDGIGGIDVVGNPYGFDLSSHDDFNSTSSMDSTFDDFNHY